MCVIIDLPNTDSFIKDGALHRKVIIHALESKSISEKGRLREGQA